MTRSKKAVGLGGVIPLILALSGAADVALRFLPTALFSFRAWECMLRFPTSDGPFTPGARYHNDRSCGDLAPMGNLPAYRIYRPETFTTDDFGFRKNPGNAASPPDALLIGDSFGAGCGVNDEETLSAQLEKLTGRSVYNACFMYVDLGRVLRQADRLGMKSGVVILEIMERNGLIPLRDMQNRPEPPPDRWRRIRRLIQKEWEGYWMASPVQIESERLYRRLQNDRILPNENAQAVVLAPLKNGQPMLFFRDDVERLSMAPEPLDLAGILKFQQELRRRNLDLWVVLTPNKYSVYAPLLSPPEAPPAGLPYLDRVEIALRQARVPAVNLLPALRAQAALEFEKNRYLYWLDDTHWNARGISLAAREIKKHIDRNP